MNLFPMKPISLSHWTVAFLLMLLPLLGWSQTDIPVDPFTGAPQINLPIWEIKDGGVSAPISLRYNGNGLKVKEGEGNAGMGWNVVGGGAITREVRGLPDDYQGISPDIRVGWMNGTARTTLASFSDASDDNLAICSDENATWSMLNGFDYRQDTEPDVFSFHAPGLSGQFVFDNTNIIRPIPYQDLKIEYSREPATQRITGFTLTSNDGVKYVFLAGPTTSKKTVYGDAAAINYFTRTYSLYHNEAIYYSSWDLYTITSPTGGTISFSYSPASEDESPAASETPVEIIKEDGTINTLYTIVERTPHFTLASISGGGYSVTLNSTDGLISKISIASNLSGLVKEFFLTYQQIILTPQHSLYQYSVRTFLEKVTEQGNCAAFPPYVFAYNRVDFNTLTIPYAPPQFEDLPPRYIDHSQDYWGYLHYSPYAPAPNPKVYVYPGQTNAERFRIRPLPGQTSSPDLIGIDRSTDTYLATTGALTKITFPPGGSANLEYEGNEYFDAAANQAQWGGGIRVKTITIDDATTGVNNDIVRTYEYLRADGKSSGRLIYRPVCAFQTPAEGVIRTTQDMAPESELAYERVTVKQTGLGKTVYEYNLPGTYPTTMAVAPYTDFVATKSKVARQSGTCTAIGSMQNGYYIYPFPPNTNYDFERGLLAKQSVYNEGGQLLSQIEYAYQRLNQAGLVAVKAMAYDQMTLPVYTFGAYTLLTNVGTRVLTETNRVADVVDVSKKIITTKTYTYNAISKLLDNTTAINSDGVTYKTRYKYAKDYALPTTSVGTPALALKALQDNFRHATVIETISSVIKASTETVMGASLTLFSTVGSQTLPAQVLSLPAGAVLTESAMSGTSFAYDSDYYLVGNFEAYNSKGNLVTMNDNRKNRKAYHWDSNSKALPLAEFSNAAAQQVVYSGFEALTDYDFQYNCPTCANTTDSWTGKYALSLPALSGTTNYLFQRQATIQKGLGKYYRFSCWVKATSAATLTITLKNGATTQATGTVGYSTANNWQYLQTEINMSAVSAQFSVQVSSNAAITVDDVLLYPTVSDLKLSTYAPPFGKTSESNAQGVSVFYEYDGLGRLVYIRDQDKNILQKKEYTYRSDPAPAVNSAFTWPTTTTCFEAPHLGYGSIECYNILVGNSVTFTPPTNCMPGVSYAWSVDGVAVTANPDQTMTYTFSQTKSYLVKLVVTHPTFGSSTTVSTIYPDPHLAFPLYTASTTITTCDASYVKKFNAQAVSGCTINGILQYKWEYRLANSNYWYPVTGPGNVPVTAAVCFFDILTVGAVQSYEIRCTVSGKCASSDPNYPDNKTYTFGTNSVYINYQFVSVCP